MANENSQLAANLPGLWSQSWPVAERPLQLELGDLALSVVRLKNEWQLSYQWTKKGNDGAFSCAYLDSAPEVQGSLDRIAMESMSTELRFQPALADRPVVVRPYSPLTIPGKNKITLYVSTPLWLSISFSSRLRRELPLQQLSDTWMGLVTGQGELCYGSHTHARLDRDLLVSLPYRAITPTTIHNKDTADLVLERLSLPTPFLSPYEVDGQLVTEPITVAMDSEKRQGIVQIGTLEDARALSTPRKRAERGVLVSALENLFA
jgi:hypothetical protein